jgi:PKD repeat protein
MAPSMFTDAVLAGFVVGTAYTDGVTADGTPAPTYSVTAGALPDGISLDAATGALTGTPTTVGEYSFTITATNANGSTSTSFSGTTGMAPSGFTDGVLAGFVVGAPYSDGVSATGTPAPTYSVTAGALPDGMTLDSVTGALTGTPTTAGAYSFTITATNENGSVSTSFTGTTGSVPSGFTDAVLGGFVVGTPYSDGVMATGTPAPTYSVTAGALPAGISLDAVTGALTGTPTTAGAYSFTITATNANGTVTLDFTGTIVGGESGYMGVTPQRLFDSRDTGGKVAAGTVHEITVLGQPGVPDDATSVAINVTADDPDAAGFFTIYPCGVATPETSSGNFLAGQTVANGTVVPLGVGGKVCVYTSAGAQLLVDLNGVNSPSASQSTLHGLAPVRLFDSRLTGGKIAAGATRTISVLGRPGVPGDATAAVINITSSEPLAAGFFTVFPCGVATPNTSNLNYVAGQTVANAATVPLGAGGTICVYSAATTDLVVDLNGIYSPTMGDGSMHSMTPERLFDSREAGAKLAAGSMKEITLVGRPGVPDGSTVVELTVTATNPEAVGFITVYPCGTSVPYVSNLNYAAGMTVANAATVSIGVGGKVCIYTSTTTDVVVDLNGVQHR